MQGSAEPSLSECGYADAYDGYCNYDDCDAADGHVLADDASQSTHHESRTSDSSVSIDSDSYHPTDDREDGRPTLDTLRLDLHPVLSLKKHVPP